MINIEEEGYDGEVIHEISNDFYCIICLKLMRNPIQFKCGHGMCFVCFQKLQRRAKQRAQDPQCPQCREIIRENQLVSNTMLHRLILSLKVHCSNSDSECKWIGELAELEEHLDKCLSTEERKTILPKISEVSKRISHNTNDVTNDIMFSILEQINNLNKKVDLLFSERLKNNNCTSCASSLLEKNQNKAKKKNSNSDKPVVSNIVTKLFIFLFMSVVLLTYLFTGQIFTTMIQVNEVSQDVKHLNQTSLDSLMDSLIQSNLNVNCINESKMIKAIRSMHNDSNRKWQSVFQIIFFHFDYQLTRLQMKGNGILDELTVSNNLKNKSCSQLEDAVMHDIELSRREINKNISIFDQHSFHKGLIENSENLAKDFRHTEIKLNISITRKIQDFHNVWVANKKMISHQLQVKLHKLQSEVRFFADYIFFNNFYSKEMKSLQDRFLQYQHSITQHSISIDQHILVNHVNLLTSKLFDKYSATLSGYFQNVSIAVSYVARFNELIFQLHHRRNEHGVFIWRLNVTDISKLVVKQAVYSTNFHISNEDTARMILYKDSTKKNYWKLTYAQKSGPPLLLEISMYNQNIEEMLPFKTALTGYIQKEVETSKFYKYFTIPLNLKQLKRKGYFKNDLCYIRCHVIDRED